MPVFQSPADPGQGAAQARRARKLRETSRQLRGGTEIQSAGIGGTVSEVWIGGCSEVKHCRHGCVVSRLESAATSERVGSSRHRRGSGASPLNRWLADHDRRFDASDWKILQPVNQTCCQLIIAKRRPADESSCSNRRSRIDQTVFEQTVHAPSAGTQDTAGILSPDFF